MRGKAVVAVPSVTATFSLSNNGTISVLLEASISSTGAQRSVMKLRKFKQSAAGYRAAKMRPAEGDVLAPGDDMECPVEVTVTLTPVEDPSGELRVAADIQAYPQPESET